jgi:hypothetical protein
MTHQNRRRPAVAGNGDLLAVGDPVEEEREVRPGLGEGVGGGHEENCTGMYRTVERFRYALRATQPAVSRDTYD